MTKFSVRLGYVKAFEVSNVSTLSSYHTVIRRANIEVSIGIFFYTVPVLLSYSGIYLIPMRLSQSSRRWPHVANLTIFTCICSCTNLFILLYCLSMVVLLHTELVDVGFRNSVRLMSNYVSLNRI
jgi:hypothetical protein